MLVLYFIIIHLGGGKEENYEKRIQVYDTEERIANEIMQTVNTLGLPFKLDQLTEGQGNCFPIAILQQMKRPEIFSQLKLGEKMMLKARSPVKILRLNVKRLITISECQNTYVERLKKYYIETDGIVKGISWDEYWTDMNKDRTWVDSWFIQATAWYLNLDLWIVDCASRDDHPFIRISGNLQDEDVPCTVYRSHHDNRG